MNLARFELEKELLLFALLYIYTIQMLFQCIATGILSLHFSVTTEHPRLLNWYNCTDLCIEYNLPHFVVEPWYIRTLRRRWHLLNLGKIADIDLNSIYVCMKFACPYWWLKFMILGCHIPVGTRLASSFVTFSGLQLDVLCCRHEQRMKMTQILQLYLKESLKLMDTLGRLCFCICTNGIFAKVLEEFRQNCLVSWIMQCTSSLPSSLALRSDFCVWGAYILEL